MNRRTALLEPAQAPSALLACSRAVILAEVATTDPRNLVQIGGRPLVWHQMMQLAAQGLTDFLVLTGPGSEGVKRFLLDALEQPDGIDPHWRIELQSTEACALRLGQLAFGSLLLISGDCISNVDLPHLLRTHAEQGRAATTMAVRPQARFGCLVLDSDRVMDFAEKSQADEGWINGGVCVLEAPALDGANTSDPGWLDGLLENLAQAGQLTAYQHESFWQRLETLREQQHLEGLWQAGNAPWKTW